LQGFRLASNSKEEIMLKQALIYTALIGSTLAGPSAASAQDFATTEEAKAMLDRAVVEVNADKAGAIAKFNHNDPRFRDRDLFVFCFNRKDGKFTAHEAMIDQDVRSLYDIWGSPFGEQMFAVKDGQTTEVTYLWPVPGSTMLAPRRTYVRAIGDQACGVSAYQSNEQVSRTH
jgi:cytochrome c